MSAAERRLELLAGLYGDAATRIDADALEQLSSAVFTRTPPPSASDAWLIAYADQFRFAGEAPLVTLRGVLDRHLAPEINGVHVLPFHPSSSDRGFSVVDYEQVDPDFGSWGDLSELAGGRRLMADAVVNHLSAQGTWFRRFLAGDPAFAEFFRTVDPSADLSAVVRPRTSPLVTRFDSADGPVNVWTTFSADQVDLDYRNPAVLLAVLDALLRYRAAGASAIRLDAIAFIWKVEGTSSISLPGTHDVIEILRSWLDEVDPGLMLITETNVPHQENVAYLGRPGCREAQAVYQFSLPPLVLHTLASGDPRALIDWAGSLDDLPSGRTYLNFTSSHDGVGLRPVEGLLTGAEVARLASLCETGGGAINRRRALDGSDVPYELASTWYSLMLAIDGDAERALARHVLSQAFVLALRGIPLLYTHVLLASVNDGERYARTGIARDLNRHDFDDVGEVDSFYADLESRPSRVTTAIRSMLRMRAGSTAFDPDASQQLECSAAVVSVVRTGSDGSTAVVHLNCGPESIVIDEVAVPGYATLWCVGRDVQLVVA